MGKKYLKTLTAGLLLGTAIIGMPICHEIYRDITPAYAYVNTIKGVSEVTVYNSALRTRLLSLLGKSNSDKLYSNDFILNDNYKVQTTVDSATGITKTYATRSYLDLSNAGIQDIRELAKFELPETLVAIDMAGNNLDNDQLLALENFLTTSVGTEITFGDTSFNSLTDFGTTIKKINLSYNQIDLDNVSVASLNNSKLLYGIQKVDFDASGLILLKDIEDAKYYIRYDDDLYLSYNFYYNGTRYNYTQNAITSLTSKPCGDFKIEIANPPSSESGYFYGMTKSLEFTIYNIYIKSDFKIERKQMFNLNVNTSNPTNMDIVIDGLVINNCQITYLDPQTNVAGTSHVSLRLSYNNITTTIVLPFKVVDTIPPEIKLKGYAKMYWRQNKAWTDPGYTGTDSGDDLTPLVDVDLGGLDVTTCGTYYITYKLRDKANNSAVTLTRTVIIQEQVLDELIINSNKNSYNINDEVILTVQPTARTPIGNYTDYKYSWYLDGVLFKTSTGDPTTGKSSITIVLDKSLGTKVTVKLEAKQKVDGSSVYVDSDTFEISTNLSVSDNQAIIIACALAVLLILAIVGITYYIKSKKAKSKISKPKKQKTDKPNRTSNPNDNIQVIKDYHDDNKK